MLRAVPRWRPRGRWRARRRAFSPCARACLHPSAQAPRGTFDSALLAGGWNLLCQAGLPCYVECADPNPRPRPLTQPSRQPSPPPQPAAHQVRACGCGGICGGRLRERLARRRRHLRVYACASLTPSPHPPPPLVPSTPSTLPTPSSLHAPTRRSGCSIPNRTHPSTTLCAARRPKGAGASCGAGAAVGCLGGETQPLATCGHRHRSF